MALEIRRATRRDLPKIAKLAGELVRRHHDFDPKRFLLIGDPESGYEWWFGKELDNPKAVILAAWLDRKIVGYAYARLEPRDFNALLDAHGALHDILVAEDARRRGVAKQLLERACAELTALGAERVVLHTATQNRPAQRLFGSVGFRKTMLEMTRELSPAPGPRRRRRAAAKP